MTTLPQALPQALVTRKPTYEVTGSYKPGVTPHPVKEQAITRSKPKAVQSKALVTRKRCHIKCCVMVNNRKARKPDLDWVQRLLATHHYTTFGMASEKTARRTTACLRALPYRLNSHKNVRNQYHYIFSYSLIISCARFCIIGRCL